MKGDTFVPSKKLVASYPDVPTGGEVRRSGPAVPRKRSVRDPARIVPSNAGAPRRIPGYRYSQAMLDALERAMAYSWQRLPSGPT